MTYVPWIILDKDLLKQKFRKNFRPQLISKCLILPEDLHDNSTEFLHHHYHLVNKRTPQYLSAYELTMQRERLVDEEEWIFSRTRYSAIEHLLLRAGVLTSIALLKRYNMIMT